jgi:hypothetical protein
VDGPTKTLRPFFHAGGLVCGSLSSEASGPLVVLSLIRAQRRKHECLDVVTDNTKLSRDSLLVPPSTSVVDQARLTVPGIDIPFHPTRDL